MATTTVPKRRAPGPAEDSSAFGPIAERFRRAGDFERAISLCQEGLQKFPTHVSARVTLGWALLESGKLDEARVELEMVLQRAPDNLAAIRGLAELHDRMEHTLNLPMDGPGQWPPDADSLDEPVVHVPTEKRAERAGGAASPARQPAAVIAPAELGLAMWSPAPAEELLGSPAASASAPAPANGTNPGSGMSSVREFDPSAFAAIPAVVDVQSSSAAATPEVLEPGGDVPPVEQARAEGPTEAELEALLAEAESLDAVAEAVDVVEDSDPAVVLDADVDLAAFVAQSEIPVAAPEPFEAGSDHRPVEGEPAAARASELHAVEVEALRASQLEPLVAAEEPALPAASAASAAMPERWESGAQFVANEHGTEAGDAPEPIAAFVGLAARTAPAKAADEIPEPVVATAPEPVVFAVAEPAVPTVSALVGVEAPDPVESPSPEPVAFAVPEPVPFAAPEAVAFAAFATSDPVPVAAPEPLAVASAELVAFTGPEPVAFAPPDPLASGAAEPVVAAPPMTLGPKLFEPVVLVKNDSKSRTIARLESFLVKVRSRRARLMSESVA